MSSLQRQVLKVVGVSTLIWLLAFVLIVLSSHSAALRFGQPSSFGMQFARVVPWYLSWLWLTPVSVFAVKLFLHNKQNVSRLIWRHALFLLLFMLVYIFSTGAVMFLLEGKLLEQDVFLPGVLALFKSAQWPYDLSIYLAVMLASYVTFYLEQIKHKDKQNALLQSQLDSAQLSALRSQLNPHFLFNALNTISGLTRMKEVDKATHALSELSYMLRVVLKENVKQLCSLKDEMTFVKKYLHFQSLRFAERLDIQLDIQAAAERVHIPVLLVHTLVENAVKHGSQNSSDINYIWLKCTVDETSLYIELRNSTDKTHREGGLGIGLANCRQRLAHLYSGNYELASQLSNEGEYNTLIVLPKVAPDV